MFSTFTTGLILGLSIAAPVGPIGVLCMRRTLSMGWAVGWVSGLGAATADGLYGCIAGFGLTAIADFLTSQVIGFRLLGGLVLCYLGLTTFFSKPSGEWAAAVVRAEPVGKTAENGWGSGARSLLTAYGSTLALTLTNPATILAFAAIFAGLGLVEGGQNFAESGVLVAGVFLGSALWWWFLSGAVSLLRSRFTSPGLRWLNRLSGIILLGFGVVALAVWR